MTYFPTQAITPDWDSITFVAGQTQVDFASTAVEVGGSIGSKWDVAEAPGTDGAKVSYQGYTPAKLTVSWKLWNDAHFQAYDRLMRIIMPKPGKQRPAPVIVLHPMIQMHGLREFVIEGLDVPSFDGKRIWTASAKLVQNFARPTASAKKAAAATNVLDAVNALAAKRKAAGIQAPGAGTQPKPAAPASPRATGNTP
jgi:hypothetical protein